MRKEVPPALQISATFLVRRLRRLFGWKIATTYHCWVATSYFSTLHEYAAQSSNERFADAVISAYAILFGKFDFGDCSNGFRARLALLE